VFGLLHFLPWLNTFLINVPGFLRGFLQTILMTLLAQLMLIPISTNIFHQIYLLGFVSNVLVLPLSAGGLAAGFLLVGLDLLAHLIPQSRIFLPIAGTAVSAYMTFLIRVVQFSADHFSARIWVRSWDWMAVGGLYLGYLAIPFLKKSLTARLGLLLSALLLFFSFVSVRQKQQIKPDLCLTWIDMGFHSSVLVESNGHPFFLVDPDFSKNLDRTERVLFPYLAERGVNDVHALLFRRDSPEDKTLLVRFKKNIHFDHVITNEAGIDAASELKLTWLEPLRKGRKDRSLLIEKGNVRVVLANLLTLEDQRILVKSGKYPLALIQARFSPKVLWDDEFHKLAQPETLVETGRRSTKNLSLPPWKTLPIAFPQEEGIYEWKTTHQHQ
jgi:hypothetical protein